VRAVDFAVFKKTKALKAPQNLGVQMGDVGCTIRFDRTKVEAVRRRQMRALLLSSALATVLAGVLQPGIAQAACNAQGGTLFSGTVVYDCGNTTNANPAGLAGIFLGSPAAIGQNLDISATGVNLGSSGANNGLTAISIGGTYDPPGQGPVFSGGGNVKVNLIGTNVVGQSDGIVAMGFGQGIDTSAIVTLRGGTVTAKNGNGITAVAGSLSDVNQWDNIDLNDPQSLTAIAGANKATVNVTTSADVSATGGHGIFALGIGTNNDVQVKATNTVESVGGFGVLAGSVGPNGTVTVTTADVSGTLGGVLGYNIGGDVTVNSTGTVLVDSGGLVGVGAISSGGNATINVTGNIDPPLIGGLALAFGNGTAKSTTSGGSIDADLIGVLALNVGDGRVVVKNSSDVYSSSGAFPIAGLLGVKVGNGVGGGGEDVKVTNQGSVSDFAVGVAGLAFGDGNKVTVLNQGEVDVPGVGVLGGAVGLNSNVTVTNQGPVSAGWAGVVGFAGGDTSKVKVTNQGAVITDGVGVAGFLSGNNGEVKVSNEDTVNSGILGVGGFAFGTGNKVDVSTTTGGSVVSDGAGVVGGAFGGGNQVKVETFGSVNADYLGVGGIVSGGNSKLDIVTRADVVSSDGFGVAGLGFGDGNTIKVTTRDHVEGDLLGVGALNFGSGTKVSVLTKDEVDSASGFGVFGGAIGTGANNHVNVTTEKKVTGDLLGVGGVVGGNASSLTILTKDKVSSDNGFGVAGLGFGNDVTIDVTTQKAVDGKYLGVGALLFGTGEVNVTTEAKVTSSDGFGVFGGAIGNGKNDVTVETQKKVEGKYLGVGGVVGGDDSTLKITTEKKVESSDGFGVAGLAFGSNLDVKVVTKDDVAGKYLGVGALGFGDGKLTVHTKGQVDSSDGVGVIGGLVGTGQSEVKVVTDKAVNAKYLGVGGLLGGNNSKLDVTTKGPVTATDGFGVAALAFGNSNTINVTTQDTVFGPLLGVGALSFGNDVDLNVHTLKTVTATDGIGVLGGNVGSGGNVNVTTDGKVIAGVAGVVGFNTGGAATVTVNDKVTADGGFVGAAAIAGGSGNATLNINGVIDPPLIGGIAAQFGTATAIANVNAEVQATAIGILGVHIGNTATPADLAIDINVNPNSNGSTVIKSDGIGISTFALGQGTTDIELNAAIRGLNQAATGGDGIFALAFGESPVTIKTTALGTIDSKGDGISVGHAGGGDINIVTKGVITAGDEGIQVLTTAFTTGNVFVNNQAAINATGNGIFILKGGNGNTTVKAEANITSATGNGIEANALFGNGNVAVSTADRASAATAVNIVAEDFGIVAGKVFGTGDVTVRLGDYSTIAGPSGSRTQLGGIAAVKGFGDGKIDVTTGQYAYIGTEGIGIYADKFFGNGDVLVNLGNNARIEARAGGIFSSNAFGTGNNRVTTGTSSTITTDGDGIHARSIGTTGETKVVTGTSSVITAGDDGIVAYKRGGSGNVVVETGYLSQISAGDDGIRARSRNATGDVLVTTGTESAVRANDDGIVATKRGGSGDTKVTVGTSGLVSAGDTGIIATNFANGPGNDVLVELKDGTLAKRTTVVAKDDAIRAGGRDDVKVSTGNYGYIAGDADESGAGNGIRIFRSDNAEVAIGTNTVVTGSGQSWSNAVVSVRSDDSTKIGVGAGSVVASWRFVNHDNLVAAASDIVIDTDGGATTITNDGTIIGRIGLTNNADTFYNNSSNTWITVGNNYFNGGNDTFYNKGRTVTAVRGAVAETTNLYSLETFVNGDVNGTQAGLITMIDGEKPGDLAYNATRDLTYTSGVFVGQGNSRLGVDTYLGGPGSTSDVLRIDARDGNGNFLPAGTVATQGQTFLVVNDVSGVGGGAYNPQGILVVDVVNPDAVSYGKYDPNHQASFLIAPETPGYDPKFGGVIDKGLFFYDVLVRGNDTYLVGIPDQEVFELPKLITGAQSIWHETTGVWLDRQADLRTYLQGTPASPLVTKEGIVKATAAPQQSVTPGLWAKVVGSWGSRDASNSFSVLNGVYGFDTSYKQNTYGLIVGADFGKEGVASRNDALIFGVLGGYITSDLSFDASPNSATYSGGTVGAYVTYLNDAWFFDALFKADFLSMDYKAPTLFGAGYFGQSADVTNLGFTLDTGYRIKWGATGFFEPLATLSYVSSDIGSLPLFAGTVVDFGTNDSLRGSLGARIGSKLFDTTGYWVEGSLTARLWYEFLGSNAVNIFNPGVPFSTTDNFDGLFGELGAGVNIFGHGNGWNGFANASVKFGDEYTAGNARGGVRYQW